MKTILLVVLLTYGFGAQAQQLLNSGESVGYEFTSLTPNHSGGIAGSAWVTISFGILDAGETMRVDLFKDSLIDTDLFQTTMIQGSFPGVGDIVVGTDLDYWSDLRGAVRITMLNGSGSLFSEHFVAEQTPRGPTYDAYAFFPVPVPVVPEPSTTALLSVALSVFVICRGFTQYGETKRKHRRRGIQPSNRLNRIPRLRLGSMAGVSGAGSLIRRR